jgi:serine/threonine protein kinase
MKTPYGLGHLKASEWDYLQGCAERFEKAWHSSGPTDMGAFLPPADHPLRTLVLQELVKADLEFRWRRGDALNLEQYLARYPELQSTTELPTTLILEEYRVRHLYGDKPDLVLYQSRFPTQFGELKSLLGEATERGSVQTPPSPLPAATPEPAKATPAVQVAQVAPVAQVAQTAPPGMGESRIQVGPYILVERIGSGGFGDVWRAEALGGFPAAVKVLFRAVDHEEAKRELHSLELIKRLRHPFLLQTTAYFFHENHLYIAMELADGSLRDRLRACQKQGQQGIPVEELVPYFKEAAEALDYLHSEKVLHRDIKPDNLLVLKGHTKVADFGLARMQEQSQRMASATGSGTPAYMAPEMWGSKVSSHTDQYCLAVSYAELRLGRRVFVGKDLLALMMEHLNSTPDLEPLARPEQDVILKALAKRPEDRYPSCKAFALALENAAVPRQDWSGLRTAPPAPLAPGDLHTARPQSSGPAVQSGDLRTLAPTGAAVAVPSAHSQTEVLPSETAPRERTWQERRTAGPAAKRSWLPWVLGGVVVAAAVIALVILNQPHPEHDGPSGPTPPEVDYLPPGCEKASTARIVEVEGKRKLYSQIDYRLADGTRVRFLLIPKESDRDPRSFYIMENKVSNKLFAAFMKSPERAGLLEAASKDKPWVLKGEWTKGGVADGKDVGNGNPDLPVLRVTVVEAYCLARWLGGNLPAAIQWDKAAGRSQQNPRAGPFDPTWDPASKDQIAINREKEGPMPVGTAAKDVSPFRCRDMSGNGTEWTRTLHALATAGVFPLDNPPKHERLKLRGRSYKASDPLRFKDGEETGAYEGCEDPDDVSFRVVLELP